MLWVALILGMLIAVSCVVATLVIALRCLQESSEASRAFIDAHATTLKTLEVVHDRNQAQISSVLDRFMALDFSLFKAYQSTETAEFGGFEEPSDDADTRLETYTPSGATVLHGMAVEERLRIAREEAQILAEDFPDEEAI